MRKVLANRNALFYVIGQALSILGDSSLWLAVGIWVKELTGSNGAAGLVFFAFMAGTLLGPLWGSLVDRVRRRPLLIAANLFSAVYILFLLGVHGKSDLWVVYPVLFVYGAMNSLFDAGQAALIPTLLSPELLPEANALLQTCRQALRLIAPLVGAGMLTAWGIGSVVWFDCATFILGAAALLLMRLREELPQREVAPGWRIEVAAGFQHLWRTAELRRMLLAISVAMAVWGLFDSLFFAVIGSGLHRSPAFYGVLMTVQGVGSVVSGPLAAWAVRRLGEIGTTAVALGAFAAGCALLVPPSTVSVLAGVLLLGFGLPWAIVGFTTLLQRRTPSGLLGRTYAAFDALTNTPQMLSTGYGAVLVLYVDYRLLLLAMIVVFAVSAGYLGLGARRGAGQGTEADAVAADAVPAADATPLR